MNYASIKYQKYTMGILKVLTIIFSLFVISYCDSEVYGKIVALLSPIGLTAGLLTSGLIPAIVAGKFAYESEKYNYIGTMLGCLSVIFLLLSICYGLVFSSIQYSLLIATGIVIYMSAQSLECIFVLNRRHILSFTVNSIPTIITSAVILVSSILQLSTNTIIDFEIILVGYLSLMIFLLAINIKLLNVTLLSATELKKWWAHHLRFMWAPMHVPIYRFVPVLFMGGVFEYKDVTIYVAALQFFALSSFVINRFAQNNLTLIKHLKKEIISEQIKIQKISLVLLVAIYSLISLENLLIGRITIFSLLAELAVLPILLSYAVSIVLGPNATYLNQLGCVNIVRKNVYTGLIVFLMILSISYLLDNSNLLFTCSFAVLMGKSTSDILNYRSIKNLYNINLSIMR